MAQYSPITTPTENARVEILEGGTSTWQTLAGVASISESGTEAPSREQASFGGKVQITGLPTPPTIEFAISGYAALHDTSRILHEALVEQKTIQIRYRFQGQVYRTVTGAANTIAIAASTGVVTLAGNSGIDLTDDEFGPGLAFKVADNGNENDYRIIQSISENGVATVLPATTLAAKADYSLELAPIYRPAFTAKVSMWDDVDAGSESQLATTLSVKPLAILPRMKVGVPS